MEAVILPLLCETSLTRFPLLYKRRERGFNQNHTPSIPAWNGQATFPNYEPKPAKLHHVSRLPAPTWFTSSRYLAQLLQTPAKEYWPPGSPPPPSTSSATGDGGEEAPPLRRFMTAANFISPSEHALLVWSTTYICKKHSLICINTIPYHLIRSTNTQSSATLSMGCLKPLFLLALASLMAFDQSLPVLAADSFAANTWFNWGFKNTAIWGNGSNLALLLDRASGSGIQTRDKYLFGSIEMQIKLVKGNSAGTVTTYYLSSPISSTGDKHDEIDFEFLGNVSGQPYTIHTNVFVQGVGNREQQFYPWFNPSADFHNYTIHWNPWQIVWFIDGIPIRVFRNYESIGIPFPNKQAMRAYSSIWNADDWATRGGLVKIDWRNSPFVARYRQLQLRACKWLGLSSINQCSSYSKSNWWMSSQYSKLNYAQIGQMAWVRKNYMIYDYCKDTKRFKGKFPLECYQKAY